ncbi:glycosyltransferase family 31 protein [Trichoderma asperellum CBS 433.97]|uniref:Glycosyltransferase family 31 protein n=2 Tax=Trichoderma asperellum TaxID=101201 RepID=A0A2T3ZNA4_TRIA4|nr:glycosyltransferase family 31 protein [Trichoderma asperellum CBS 433.97]PTB46307.1 glycosyltransferase family 31 protein [Trichoderma asperellum CBS 433.97]
MALVITVERLVLSCTDGIYCRGQHQVTKRPEAFKHDHSQQADGQSALLSIEAPSDILSTASAPEPAGRSKHAPEPGCAQFPDTSKVLLVMKTKASEAFSKLPTQLITNLKCLPEFLIFGDIEQEIGGYTVHDSLDRVLDSVKTDNRDFDDYFRQRQCATHQKSCSQNVKFTQDGWDLDKYKSIHIAEKTFNMRPNYDWYLFVDAGAYVVWPTMLRWLEKMDHTGPMYIGNKASVGDTHFGDGGSGYVVSNIAMRDLFEGKHNVANRWDEATKSHCCGDLMFAKALKETAGISVNDTWPTMNGEKPFTISYSSTQWCQPIATMNHLGSEELSALYAFERGRNFASPMRIRDLYHHFVAPQLVPFRPDWDNMSDDVFYLNMSDNTYDHSQLRKAKLEGLSPLEKMAHLSFDSCLRACQVDPACLQYRYHDGVCGFSWTIKHGYPKPKASQISDRWMSGWDVDKIQPWVQEHDDCADEIKWPLV